MGSTTASGARAPRAQPPRAQAQRTCCVRDSGAVRCPRPPLPPCLDRHHPPPDLCLRTPREPGAGGESVRSARKNLGRQPSAKSFSYPLLLVQIILTRGGERRGTRDCAPLGASSAEKAHLAQIRPSVAFFPPADKARALRVRSGCSMSSGPLHGESEPPASAPEAGQRHGPTAPGMRPCALAGPGPRAGGQEVSEAGSVEKAGGGGGDSFSPFQQGFRSRVGITITWCQRKKKRACERRERRGKRDSGCTGPLRAPRPSRVLPSSLPPPPLPTICTHRDAAE